MTRAKPAAINQQILLGYGFERHGKFTLGSDGLAVFNFKALRRTPSVYALAVGRRVVYIGATGNLRRRIRDHCRPPAERTPPRGGYVRGRILVALRQGESVDLLAYRARESCWHDLIITDEFGIEAALVGRYRPEWNLTKGAQGRRRIRGEDLAA